MGEETKKKPIYKKWWFWLIIIILINVIRISASTEEMGMLLFPIIIVACSIYFLIKYNRRQKEIEEEMLQKDKEMLEQGYNKIYNDIYINEKENAVIIKEKKIRIFSNNRLYFRRKYRNI